VKNDTWKWWWKFDDPKLIPLMALMDKDGDTSWDVMSSMDDEIYPYFWFTFEEDDLVQKNT
jgi:hypothetical protein